MFSTKALTLAPAGLLMIVLLAFGSVQPASGELPAVGSSTPDSKMSAMGQLAWREAHRTAGALNGSSVSFDRSAKRLPGGGADGGEGQDGPAGGQAELSIAVDITGSHIVVGFNDTRGFNLNPVSVSGFAWSDDGGATFTDGRMPASGNPALNGAIGGTLYPKVFGDPDVKYVPGGNGLQFLYSGILIKGTGTSSNFTGTAQTMGIFRSFDGGHSWEGPFEVTAATVPSGAADKEFIDVDPDTGRVLISWTSFGSGAQISTAYSDDIMTGNPPTWSARSVLNPGAGNGGQGPIPRFAGNGSPNVYVAWGKESSDTAENIGFAVSTDNGVSWSPPISLRSSNFFVIDYILGNDRVHQFPGLAVDNSPGTNGGNVYVVYADNNNHDGADIVFQRSTNGGSSFANPIYLNSRPGVDRAQWFPYVTVDRNTGRVSVIFYDQGIATSGDLSETTWVYSDDGGVTWSAPTALTSRPFHAGYGNDSGQPNLGDYIGATAQNGFLYAAWAGTAPLVSFVDGQPGSRFTVPDFVVGVVSNAAPALNLAGVSVTESGGNGFLDPGDTVNFDLPLRNFVTNPQVGTATYTGVSAALYTTNQGVVILVGTNAYPELGPGTTQTNVQPFQLFLEPGFIPGTTLEFTLAVATAQGVKTLLFSQPTGTPVGTTIFSENFDGVPAGSLPAGWTNFHNGGANVVPWTTVDNVPGATTGSNSLFHIDANDGVNGDATRWEQVSSPTITIPPTAAYVTLDFDTWYDTEDNTYSPGLNIYGFDGATLRIADLTSGHVTRTNLVEAFAEEFSTGSLMHFPKHLPRNDNTAYFQDMSVWGGYSDGWQHVHLKLPGMAGTTVQLRWDYTQDTTGTAADVRPGHTFSGVAIDNIVLQSVVIVAAPKLSIAHETDSVQLSWNATPGADYQVQFTANLSQPNWNTLATVTATNSIAVASDAIQSSEPRLYRVVAGL
jgi:BNR/Asp-box repeat